MKLLSGPSLAFFFSFFVFVLEEEKPVSPKKGNFCLFFCVSLCFAFAFFDSPFPLSLSLSLALSASSFLYVFLLCFLSLVLQCFCLFVSLPCFFAFLSWKEQHQNIKFERFLSSILSFVCYLSCFVFQIFVSYLDLCFLFSIEFLCFKKRQVIKKRKNQFLVKLAVETKLLLL